MIRDFDDVIDEVRKHPGITAGTLALVAGAAIATVLLTQRTGPRRYEWIRERLDPRGWIDAEALRHRFEDISRGLSEGAEDLSHKAGEFTDDTRHGARKLFKRGQKAISPSKRRRYARAARGYAQDAGRNARRYAGEAGQYARDHAREGGALLAVATIAAAIGAAVLETRRPESRLRRMGKF